MHGLTRVRGMTQDDAHIFCTKEQMADELRSLLVFVLDLLRDYGLDDFYLELSTEPEGKAVGHGRRSGRRRPRRCARSRSEMDLELRPRRGRRRVLRPEDLGPGARRDRADVAALDDPGRLPAPAALRPRSTSAPTTSATGRS